MLRITPKRDDATTTVRLEGRLAGPWVIELSRWWQTECETRRSESVCVDLSDVAFIDPEGRRLLERMSRRGVELRARGCMTRALCDEIVEAARQGDDAPTDRPPDRAA